MRRLIYVPVIHTLADMGSKSAALKEESVRRLGAERWARGRQVIDEMWEGIEARLLALDLPWDRVRIYQDGLPLSGKEFEIARAVADEGSKNYQLVIELVRRGARLMGTEDPSLLKEDYHLLAAVADAADEAAKEHARAAYARESSRILGARDAFIGRRIAETLEEGEVGVLFMGMMHEIESHLPEDIQVEFLIDRLPLWEVQGRS